MCDSIFQQVSSIAQNIEHPLILKPINDLLEKDLCFLVDKYQRGYRWGKSEVDSLLDDIDEYKEIEDSFYCLQPVVVKSLPKEDSKEHWELIDGQQRMTTIYLILNYLRHDHYRIHYTTREGSEEFLLKYLNDAETHTDWNTFINCYPRLNNIDNHHFFLAYRIIKSWFEKITEEKKKAWLNKLLNHTRIIWYVVNPESGKSEVDSRAVFMRINSGKIPLTNAELIKALLLQNAGQQENLEIFQLHQNEMARDWDIIEQHLQDDEFWFFINANAKRQQDSLPTRIEFLFKLINNPSGDEFALFNTYAERIRKSSNSIKEVKTIWKEVKECHYQLQEWYESDELYHLAGYLISREIETLKKLREQALTQNKKAFANWMKERVAQELRKYFINEDTKIHSLDQLKYTKDKKELHNILVLLEIHLAQKQKNRISFQVFPSYGQKDWTLEHIHAQNSKELSGDALHKYQKTLLDGYENEFSHKATDIETLRNMLDNWYKQDKDKPVDQSELYSNYKEELVKLVGEFDDQPHSITNLTLLSSSHNSTLNNSLFAVKRRKLQLLDRNGEFIPLATKHIFAKYFSDDTDNLYKWTEKDRIAYCKVICECLENHDPALATILKSDCQIEERSY